MIGSLYGLVYFAGGYIWYFGFATVASWMRRSNVSAGSVASGAVTGLAIGYIFGGRRGAKASGITMLVILGITLSIGFLCWIIRLYKDIWGSKAFKKCVTPINLIFPCICFTYIRNKLMFPYLIRLFCC